MVDSSMWGARTRLRRFIKGPTGRYIVVGGSVYVIELSSIVILQYNGINTVLAVALSFWLGLVLSFALQKYIAFNDKRSNRHILFPQIIAFTLLVAFNFGFTLLVTKVFLHLLPTVLSRTLALGVTTVWNFYLYKTRIFKQANTTIFD
jgi:putative flippase GtrA